MTLQIESDLSVREQGDSRRGVLMKKRGNWELLKISSRILNFTDVGCQKLGLILENKVFQKVKLAKNVKNKTIYVVQK